MGYSTEPAIIIFSNIDLVVMEINIRKNLVPQLDSMGGQFFVHFHTISFFAWNLLISKFCRSFIDCTTSTTVLSLAALLATFIDSTADKADRGY